MTIVPPPSSLPATAELEKSRRHRENVINEIIKTELTYNMGLQMMRELVTIPLQRALSEGKLQGDLDPQIPQFFEKLSQVQMISDTLKSELNRYMTSQKEDTTEKLPIGKCFERFPKLIIIYFDYIRTFHATNPILVQARETNKCFDQLLIGAEQKLEDTVEGFLITPVQRPPRYRLLLQELLKTTPENSEDYQMLKNALDKICDEISKVDEAIVVFEEAVKMGELQVRFGDNFEIFIPRRRLFFQCDSMKFSRKWTNQRFVVVLSDILVVADYGMMNSLKVNKRYKTGEYLITNVEDQEPFINAVDIRQKEKSFRINLNSLSIKNGLLEAFEKVIKLNGLKKVELEKKGFAPVWIPDNQAPNCMECNAQFTFFNRRHHCRSCGGCVCKNCFQKKIVIPGLDVNTPQGVCNRCYKHIIEISEESEESIISQTLKL